MKRSRHSIDMCSGSLWNKILLFALPLMASSMLQLLFNAADVAVVGRFAGKEALAAVGSNGSLINLLVNLFIGLSVGASVVVSRDLGAGRHREVNRDAHCAILLALIGGMVIMVAGVFLARPLLVLMSSPADVIDLSALYLRIYFLGMPANMLYNFGAAILRAQGDTQRPLYYLSFAGLVNVVLNLFFVIVLHMSVAGVAIATVASQVISAALVIRCLMREEGPLHLEAKKLRLEGPVVRRILKVGIPAGIQGTIFSMSNVVIQSGLNSFNDAVIVAGAAAANNVESFIYAAMNAFHQAAQTFAGQNYGAARCERVNRTLFLCLGYGVSVGLAMGSLVYFLGAPLLGIYAPGDAAVIEQGLLHMKYMCFSYWLCGFMEVMTGVLRGIGYSVSPTIISMTGACGLRVIWVATVFRMFPSPATLYTAYPVSWLSTVLIQIVFFALMHKRAYARVQGEYPAYYLG